MARYDFVVAMRSGGSGSRYAVYGTVLEYNVACPDALMPTAVTARNILRSFTCAGAGLQDDLTASEASYTLDFLPGGAPEPGEVDRAGTVVASRWGGGPYLVLAEHVSLRGAWRAVVERWPTELSAAVEVLRVLADTSASDAGPS